MSLNMSTLNKTYSGLIQWSSEGPNAPYSSRYGAALFFVLSLPSRSLKLLVFIEFAPHPFKASVNCSDY